MATGLATRSKDFRTALQTRNYYSPTNVYDINNNSVTKALNAVNQYTNFDLRNSFITNYVEGSLIQDSPIVKNAQMQQLKFLTLNTAQKVIQNQMPVFNMNQGGNLLSKAKDFFTGKAYKFRSLAITSKDAQNKEIISVNNLASLLVGGIDHGYSKSMFEKIYGKNSIGENIDTFKNDQVMEFNFNILGDFTKDVIVNLSNQNFYGPRRNNSVIRSDNGVKDKYLLNNLMNGGYFSYLDTGEDAQRTYLQKNLSGKDGFPTTAVGLEFKTKTIEFDLTGNENPYDEFLSFNGKKAENDRKIEQDYGFGTTQKVVNGKVENLEGIFNIENAPDTGAKRGLLYFTKKILETEHGKHLAGDNIKYLEVKGATPTDDVYTYRGRSACRSWTNKIQKNAPNTQYGSDLPLQLLTFNNWNGGNNVQNSVMFDSVRPNIHPKLKSNDNIMENDKRRYMFSMENLAFDTGSYANLPKSEQGYFGGRLMWFAPYGITFTEQTTANWESHKFVGRPEPVYSYNGSERTGTLSFMLIMDYPLSDYKLDKMDYSQPDLINNLYKDCDDKNENNNKPTTNQKTYYQSVKRVDSESSSDLVKPMLGLTVYFDNNSNTIDFNYNPQDVNDDYNLNIDKIKQLINSEKGNNHNITIHGYCSAKYLVNYNAKLGFRRAYELMKACYQGSLKNPDNFVDTTFTYKKDSKGNKVEITSGDTFTNVSVGTVFTFTSSDNSDIKFNLISYGENFSTATDTASIDAIKSRNAFVQNIVSTKTSESKTLNDVIVIDKTTSKVTQTTETLENNKYQDWESPATIGKSNKDLSDINFAKPNSEDSVYMKTFIPTYHSQTPYDFHNRLTFLNQCVRPGKTLSSNDKQYIPTNSVFGKQPVIILRLGDFLHTKLIITNLDIKYEQLWDLNPNGHGVQPMVATVTLGVKILGGQSLATPVAQLQNAISTMFYANSTFNPGAGFKPFENNEQIKSATKNESNQLDRYNKERDTRNKEIEKMLKTQ
jgi:outer membrane protein OmpA-like peptidoglycan-associated protein